MMRWHGESPCEVSCMQCIMVRWHVRGGMQGGMLRSKISF